MKKEIEEHISESSLLRFFAGQTTDQETEEIIKWICSSEECSQKARDVYYIYYTTELKQTKRSIDVDAAFKSVEQKINRKRKSLYRTNIFQLIQKIAVVAILPLSIFTGYLLTNSNTDNQVHYVEVSAKRGMVTKTVLPDSTVVWLNSGSTLKYPSVFLTEERSVELEGEAYFDVKKSEDQTFIINKDKDLSISVLGTEFNVEAYVNDESIAATLVEGSVKVQYKDDQGQKKDIYLSPSQKLVYDINNKKAETKEVSVAQYIAWKDGKIIFENTSLKDVLRLLGRHFNVDFRIKNKELYSNAFTGKFEGERLDEILELIKISSNINYKYIQEGSFNEKRLVEIY